MSRNLMSLFIKIISLYKAIHFFAILYPTSLANLVVEVGTRHSQHILLQLKSEPRYNKFHLKYALGNVIFKMATILFWPQCVKYNTLTKYLHRFVDPRRHFCDLPVGKPALFLLTTPRPLMISTYLRHSTWGLRLAVLAELPRPSPVDPSRLDAVTVQIIKQVYGKMEKGRKSIDIALELRLHYSDVVMGAMAYQITSLAIVYSTVYSGADQRKHQSYASLAFGWGIHRWPVHSPHKWPVTGKMFPFDDVIMFSLKPSKLHWKR